MKQARSTTATILFACLAATMVVSCASKPGETPEPRQAAPIAKAQGASRAIFVTRWDYRTGDDIERIISQTKAAGFTDIYWQVRGQADAGYASDLEPWVNHLGEGSEGPGFDPLEQAVALAHEQGMRLHAWVNVLTLWHGRTPPTDRRHIKLAHPEWALANAEGVPLVTRDGYELVNPARPEVRSFVASVAADIAARYALDGLCLDALRIPADLTPTDPLTKRLFSTENAEALGAGEDRAAVMERWLGEQVDLMVEEIATAARDARSELAISAVVVGSDANAARAQRQHPDVWIERKSVDRLLLLASADSGAAIQKIENAWRGAIAGKAQDLTPTIMPAAALSPEAFADQLSVVGPREDAAIFAFSALFETADPAIPRDVRSVAMRAAKRQVLVDRWVPKPAKPAPAEDLNAVRGVPQPPPKPEGKPGSKKDANKEAPEAKPSDAAPESDEKREPAEKDAPKEPEKAEPDDAPAPPPKDPPDEDPKERP